MVINDGNSSFLEEKKCHPHQQGTFRPRYTSFKDPNIRKCINTVKEINQGRTTATPFRDQGTVVRKPINLIQD